MNGKWIQLRVNGCNTTRGKRIQLSKTDANKGDEGRRMEKKKKKK